MAKKKKFKKHQFKQRNQADAPLAPAAMPSAEVAAVTSTSVPKSVAPVVVESADLAFVKRDLRKVAVLAAGFVALQLILWYLFRSTALGSHVYSLIKV